jgi:hypothetical protein
MEEVIVDIKLCPQGGSYFALVSLAKPPQHHCLAFGPLVILALAKSRRRSASSWGMGRRVCTVAARAAQVVPVVWGEGDMRKWTAVEMSY